jgi:protein O-GlcNAc transferase
MAADSVARIFNEALSAMNKRDFTRAEKKFRKVLQSDRSHVPALNLLSVVLMSLGRFADAEQFVARAVELNQSSDVSFYNYGLISKELNKPQQAYEKFTESLKLNPNVPETWNNRGAVCNDLKEYELALSDFDRAASLNGAYAEAYANRGNSLMLLKRYDEAVAAYHKALSIKPGLAEAWLGRGNASAALSQYKDGLVAYDKILSFKPELAQAWIGRGNMLVELMRYDEALASFDRALSLNQQLEGAWFGRGNVFLTKKQFENAFAAFDKALSLNPDLPLAEGSRLHAKMHCCDWSAYQVECEHLVTSLRDGKLAAFPFHLLAVNCEAKDQLKCAEAFIEDKYPAVVNHISSSRGQNANSGTRIRLAYMSTDYRQHATSNLTAGLFEAHDHSRFDVIGLSVGPNDGSQLRKRLEQSFMHFVDMSTLTDEQIAAEISKLDVDILVDLNGHTHGARTGALRYRPSPIQVNYLGYPGTMGCSFVDYIIADRTLISENDRNFYSEKVVLLPHSYQANDRKREIAETELSRHDCGLPDGAFVFCCFNGNYKITPDTFDCWMTLLRQSSNSVLWLLEDNKIAAKNLRKEAQQRDVDPSRLIFAERAPLARHLARHRLADLFLDTVPCNAHTTASDALWAGLPVLARIGQTFAGRVAASLLNAVGLPELITHSREEYEALALDLVKNRERLLRFRTELDTNRLTKPLFDTALFAQHIEAAYEEMFRRYHAGLPPDDIRVQAMDTIQT